MYTLTWHLARSGRHSDARKVRVKRGSDLKEEFKERA